MFHWPKVNILLKTVFLKDVVSRLKTVFSVNHLYLKNSFIVTRQKRGTHLDNVVANTNLQFQHDGSVNDLNAHVDNQLAASTPLSDAGFTAKPAKTGDQEDQAFCDQCMNGGVFFEPEPAAECAYFSSAPAFQIGQAGALASVPIVTNFEFSFTLFFKEADGADYRYKEIINFQDPTVRSKMLVQLPQFGHFRRLSE